MRKSLLMWLGLGVLGVACGPIAAASAAGDANTASCANEALTGFRADLPDCRAYELMTPTFKDGVTLEEVNAVSTDGSRLLATSTGAFAGAESDNFGTHHLLSRSGSGWAASAIEPPASRFVRSQFFAASPDLDRSLWAVRASSQPLFAKDLYLREADGTFVRIGSMVPPSQLTGPSGGASLEEQGIYAFRGVSNDLSHVLFSISLSVAFNSVGWPGDTTLDGKQSLYEYVGVENTQPKLVGVDNSGKLISTCGTSLGGESSKDLYNAMSASGERVFFTAEAQCESGASAPEVNELYARLDGIETVSISEPSSRQCRECQTVTRAPAEFQGASADGSKVFFLTEQELLPGAATMNLYEYDFGNQLGEQVVRVSVGASAPEVQGVARVSQDGSHEYFVAKGILTQGANAQGREPVAGGENLYVFERDATYAGGRVAFVATLSAEDGLDWMRTDARPVQATPDGRFLVFESLADLTPGDASSQRQVFEYDALTGELARVSIGQPGFAGGAASADANSSEILSQGFTFGEGLRPTEPASRLAISRDGSQVLFSTAGALAPGAAPASAAGAASVYEYRSSGAISNGYVYLISDGRDVSGTERGKPGVIGLSESGADVFFGSGDPLLGQEVVPQTDIYDAHAGGGFPALPAPQACAGEACHGAPASQSTPAAAGSESVPGGGNLSPSPYTPAGAPKARPLTRAQKLAAELKACRRRRAHRRAVCEAQARKRYRVKSTVNAKGNR